MQTHYNTLAGEEVGRIAALSDGIFAIAATILVLDFHTPEPADIHSEAELLRALAVSAPRLLPWLLSSLRLGIFWLGQQTQLSQLARSNRDLAWLHFLFLGIVTVLPFSTRLLADFLVYRTAFLTLGQYRCPWRVPLRHMGLCRTREAHPGGSAWRYLARGQATHRRGAVVLRDRRACGSRQRDAWDHPDHAHSAELCDWLEAGDSFAPLMGPRDYQSAQAAIRTRGALVLRCFLRSPSLTIAQLSNGSPAYCSATIAAA